MAAQQAAIGFSRLASVARALNGAVRRKVDKRRIEDIADIDGVRHVQNNLRVRDRGPWSLF